MMIKNMDNLMNLKVIVTLGNVAFDNCVKLYKKKFKINQKFKFKHGKKYVLPDGKYLIPSYHPSPRNVNTKLISQKMMVSLFKKVKKRGACIVPLFMFKFITFVHVKNAL